MGTIVERDGRYLVRIRRRGVSNISYTFGSGEIAKSWKQDVDCLIDSYLSLSRHGVKTDLSALLAEIDSRAMALTDKKRKPVSGIYFLMSGNECIYVGQSLDIHQRLKDHRAKGVEFDRAEHFVCQPDKLDDLERYYIKTMSPKLNGVLHSVLQT